MSDFWNGYMPSKPPLDRLPSPWDAWENLLADAIDNSLQLGDKLGLTDEEKVVSEKWRCRVRETPIIQLPPDLVRARLVLVWILRFYMHTLPPTSTKEIPPSITVPLLQVSEKTGQPPVSTYADEVLFNCYLPSSSSDPQCIFLSNTNSKDEAAFHLTSARVEWAGKHAMQSMHDITSSFDVDLDPTRLATQLDTLTTHIHTLRTHLLSIKTSVNPDFFYNRIRPWLAGGSFLFTGSGDKEPEARILAGSSAAQSPLIQTLDAFLGLTRSGTSPRSPASQNILNQMRAYMVPAHRVFIEKLEAERWGERLQDVDGHGVKEAYARAVEALRQFRDAHIVIVTLFVVGPARRVGLVGGGVAVDGQGEEKEMKGTAGTDLMRFLKDVRDSTITGS